MTAIGKTRARKPALLICAAAFGAPACGDDDFKNEPRPAVPIELGAVIKPKRVIVAPNHLGAGPVRITISNQTSEAHSVTLAGQGVSERVPPVYPQDTARIQKTLEPGRYELRAGSADDTSTAIAPAELTIGSRRPESNDRLLLP